MNIEPRDMSMSLRFFFMLVILLSSLCLTPFQPLMVETSESNNSGYQQDVISGDAEQIEVKMKEKAENLVSAIPHNSMNPDEKIMEGMQEGSLSSASVMLKKVSPEEELTNNNAPHAIEEVSVGVSGGIQAVSDDPQILSVSIVNASSNEEIEYGLPGMNVTVSFEVKGKIDSNKIKLEFRRDIVGSLDTTLVTYETANDVDLESSETLVLSTDNITLDATLSDFGRDSGDIRSYFVKIIEDKFSDRVLYEGGIEEQKGGFLAMFGDISLDLVEYYNVTDDGDLVPITLSLDTWSVAAVVHFTVSEGAVWDRYLVAAFRYNVRLGLDTEVDSTPAVIDLTETVLPGSYYFNFSADNMVPLQFDGDLSYGSGFGEVSSVYAQLFLAEVDNNGDATRSSQLDYTVDREYTSLRVLDDLADATVHMEIVWPRSADKVSGANIEVFAIIHAGVSNYLIDAIKINGVDVSSSYDPSSGYLLHNISTPGAGTSSIFEIVLSVEIGDFSDQTSVWVQYEDPGLSFPQEYGVESINLIKLLFNESSTFSTDFYYEFGGGFGSFNLTPILTIGFAVRVVSDVHVAYPQTSLFGYDNSLFVKASTPRLEFVIDISLDLMLEVTADTSTFSVLFGVYDARFIVPYELPLGIFTFSLAELIGEDLARSFTHLEIRPLQYIPATAAVSWLVDLVLALDILPFFTNVFVIEADVTETNANLGLTKISFTSSDTSAYTITPSDNEADVSVSLDNFRYSYQLVTEVFFQLSLSGQILFYNIGTIDINEWLANSFGIEIPSLRVVSPEISLMFDNTEPLSFTSTVNDTYAVIVTETVTETVTENITVIEIQNKTVTSEATVTEKETDVQTDLQTITQAPFAIYFLVLSLISVSLFIFILSRRRK